MKARPEYPALTSIRYVAAVLVVLFHFGQLPLSGLGGAARGLMRHGYLGVDVFFVLSGLIITVVYLSRLDGSRTSRRQFWVARVARIYPVYLVSLILIAPWEFHAAAKSLSGDGTRLHLVALVAAPLALQSWVPGVSQLWNYPAWSISVEFGFYALIPFVLPYLARRRTNVAVGLCVGFWAVATVVGSVVAGLLNVGSGAGSQAARFLNLTCFPLSHFAEFALGVAAGIVVARAAERLARIPAWLLIAGVLVPVPLVFVLADVVSRAVLQMGVAAPLFAVSLLCLVPSTPLSRALGGRVLLVAGGMSYALYMLQIPIAVLAGHAGLHPSASWSELVVYLFLLHVAAFVAYRYFETPARLRMRRAFDLRRVPPEIVAATPAVVTTDR